MAPEDRKRAIETEKAGLEMIQHASQAGLSVETPEQIQPGLGRIQESIEPEASSDD